MRVVESRARRQRGRVHKSLARHRPRKVLMQGRFFHVSVVVIARVRSGQVASAVAHEFLAQQPSHHHGYGTGAWARPVRIRCLLFSASRPSGPDKVPQWPNGQVSLHRQPTTGPSSKSRVAWATRRGAARVLFLLLVLSGCFVQKQKQGHSGAGAAGQRCRHPPSIHPSGRFRSRSPRPAGLRFPHQKQKPRRLARRRRRRDASIRSRFSTAPTHGIPFAATLPAGGGGGHGRRGRGRGRPLGGARRGVRLRRRRRLERRRVLPRAGPPPRHGPRHPRQVRARAALSSLPSTPTRLSTRFLADSSFQTRHLDRLPVRSRS